MWNDKFSAAFSFYKNHFSHLSSRYVNNENNGTIYCRKFNWHSAINYQLTVRKKIHNHTKKYQHQCQYFISTWFDFLNAFLFQGGFFHAAKRVECMLAFRKFINISCSLCSIWIVYTAEFFFIILMISSMISCKKIFSVFFYFIKFVLLKN